MLSLQEKQVYNNHLAVSRKMAGKPFKLRKNFDKVDEETVFLLKKLSKWFDLYPHVKQEDFFKAPFKIYPDETSFFLSYFITKKALTAYTLYMKEQDLEDPDTFDSLRRLQQSLIFVYKYCSENKIPLSEYETFTIGVIPEYITHLKKHYINFYTLHTLNFATPTIDPQVLDFMFKDFHISFMKSRNSFFYSKKMKSFSLLAKQKVDVKIQIELEKTK